MNLLNWVFLAVCFGPLFFLLLLLNSLFVSLFDGRRSVDFADFAGIVFDNWYWFLLAYAVAFCIFVAVFVYNELRSAGYLFTFANGFNKSDDDSDSPADCDSDSQSRANLDRAIGRESGRRSIQRPDGVGRLGRHVPGGEPVRELPETLAS